MSKTKIIVLQMKELVYTGIFVGLGILLIVLLFVMFYPKKEKSSDATADVTAEAASYVPGIYNSELKLGENHLKSRGGCRRRPDQIGFFCQPR